MPNTPHGLHWYDNFLCTCIEYMAKEKKKNHSWYLTCIILFNWYFAAETSWAPIKNDDSNKLHRAVHFCDIFSLYFVSCCSKSNQSGTENLFTIHWKRFDVFRLNAFYTFFPLINHEASLQIDKCDVIIWLIDVI